MIALLVFQLATSPPTPVPAKTTITKEEASATPVTSTAKHATSSQVIALAATPNYLLSTTPVSAIAHNSTAQETVFHVTSVARNAREPPPTAPNATSCNRPS
jgi:hypothetical protein